MSKKTLFILFILLAPLFSSFSFFVSKAQAIANGDDVGDFTLKSSEGKDVKLSDYKDKVIVLEWFNIGCPFSKNHYNFGNMQNLQRELTAKGIIWLTINSTNDSHSDYRSLEQMKEDYKSLSMGSTALLQDPNGKVGKKFKAVSTPHMFVISKDSRLVYQGAIDERPSFDEDPKDTKNYVLQAVNEILEGKPVSVPQTEPYGCSVKY